VAGSGSVIVRRQLGRELRAWREKAGRTMDDVAEASVASVSKVQRIEHGRTSVRPGDVWELCRLYGVNEATTEALADLARAISLPDWWERSDTSAPAWFSLYLRLESVASDLCTFEHSVIHGLFQTRAYAEQVERLATPEVDEALIARYVATRLARQRHVFERPDLLHVRLVLGEVALRTRVGSPAVLEAQHAHLRELARRDHVSVRILTPDAGIHPGVRGAFSVLDFPEDDDPPVAYVESYEAARYPESPALVARYRLRFEQTWALATPIEEYPL
jgi:transcriptional regulator with XRE-family HTH domain